MNRDKIVLDSMVDMFLNCKIPHQYIIFVNNYNNRKRIIKYLTSQVKTNEDIFITYSCAVFTISNLKTGAFFRLLQTNTNCRGSRAFLSLYEDACPKEFVDTIIRPICFNTISFNVDWALIEED